MPSQAICLAWVAEAIRRTGACPALPHREALEGQGALPDLGLQGAAQLKEGRSQSGNSTRKGQGQGACECAQKAGGSGGGPEVVTVSLELKELGKGWRRAQADQAIRRRAD